MILPLLSAYFLFASVTAYYDDKKVEEYYEAYSEIQTISNVVRDPSLYKAEIPENILSEMTNEQVSIRLYNHDGLIMYSSLPDLGINLNKETIYRNLYELEQGLQSFTYKEPVFVNNEIVGLFEIEIAREEFMSTVVKKGWIFTGLFIVFFIFIYLAVALIIHNRLNKRFHGLMDEMSAFASGNSYVETETGNDEIGELKQHFYAMRKQIIAAQEVIKIEQKAKEYMVATISHDLKTPLTSIKAYAESLNQTDNLSEEEKELYRNVIIEKSDFMKQMLDDLITHTLLQSQDYELELVTVDGEEFFEMLISDYDALCEGKSLQLTTFNNVTGKYNVNPKQIMRVVDNLMMNAIQHSFENGKISIVAISENTELNDIVFDFVMEQFHFDFEKFTYLIVQNEGAGIAEDKMPYLFDPLYQVDQARSKKDAHGTGLGLSITKQIIEKHGGTVTALSEVNKGACFICSLQKKEG